MSEGAAWESPNRLRCSGIAKHRVVDEVRRDLDYLLGGFAVTSDELPKETINPTATEVSNEK